MHDEDDGVDALGHLGLFVAVGVLGIAVSFLLAFLGWI